MGFFRGLVWGLVLLVGCGLPGSISEKDFARVTGTEYCQRLLECDRGFYLSEYYGMGDCVAHIERDLQDLLDLAEDLDCDYSANGAARAFEDLATMGCDDFYEGDFNNAVDKVWDECALSLFF